MNNSGTLSHGSVVYFLIDWGKNIIFLMPHRRFAINSIISSSFIAIGLYLPKTLQLYFSDFKYVMYCTSCSSWSFVLLWRLFLRISIFALSSTYVLSPSALSYSGKPRRTFVYWCVVIVKNEISSVQLACKSKKVRPVGDLSACMSMFKYETLFSSSTENPSFIL